MKKKCKNCTSNAFELYPNNLCQKCLSQKLENNLKENDIELKLTSSELIQEYLIEKKSIRNIAKKNTLKPFQVRKLLVQFRIPIKSRNEQISNKINEEVFEKLNTESSFLLGYIFTDGNLVFDKKKGNYFLQIYSKHKYLLENTKNIFKTDVKIQHREQKNYGNVIQGEIYWIHIGNQKIISSLIRLGMVSKKNHDIKFPDISKKLIPHFIRGCWTGNGCVSKYNTLLLSQLTIGSIDFIKTIERHLNEAGLTKRNFYTNKQSKKPSYVIRYATSDSEKLYKYLYKGKTKLTICRRQEKLYKEKFMYNF